MAKQKLNRIDTSDTVYVPTVSDIIVTDMPANETPLVQKTRNTFDLTEPQILPGIGEIAMISLDYIVDSPYQTREQRDEDEFQQLVHSIKTLKKRLLLFVCHHPKKQEYYFPVMGGHLRRDAAKEAGLTEMLVIIIEYDQHELGLGTAQENLSRQDLSIVAKGKLFKQLRDDFGWSQERLANELGIRGVNRDTIASCELTIKYALDIQHMLTVKREGGIRAARYLEQLTAFYQDQPGMAEQVRAPIIEAFLADKISTDWIRKKVEDILHSSKKEDVSEVPIEQEEPISKRWTRIESTEKSLRSFLKLIGDTTPTEDERTKLTTIRENIDAVLARS